MAEQILVTIDLNFTTDRCCATVLLRAASPLHTVTLIDSLRQLANQLTEEQKKKTEKKLITL